MKLKRIISGILAAAMSLTILPSIPAKAETGSKIYTYDGYQVEYTVQNEWTNNQSVQVTVTNTDDESILNWALKYDAKGEINGLWNGSVYKQENTSYIVKNAGYNYEIKPNQSVNFGYTLTGEALTAPDKFEMCTKRADKKDGYNVAFNITDDWDTGFQGAITVNNTSSVAIEGWMLSFDSNFTISDLWNGKIVSSNGTSYVVANEQWTSPIQPNSSVTIGFTASKTAGTTAVAENFKLSEVVIDETTPVIVKPETPVITAAVQYDSENNIANVNWTSSNPNGIFEILTSPDGINFESIVTVKNQNSYMLSLAGCCKLMYIKVKQVVDNDVTSESNVVVINNSSNYNEEKEESLITDEDFYVSVESDLESLKQVNHSSAITLQYSINCYLENVESFKVTCSYSNVCLLSENVQCVSVDNPTFELSCTSLDKGRGIVTVKVEAITDSGNIKPNMAQKIYIIATDTYDYISVNNFEQAEKKCVESQFKNNEINALEYAQRVQNLPYGYDDNYINNLAIDYIVTHVDESIKIFGEDSVNYLLKSYTKSNLYTVSNAPNSVRSASTPTIITGTVYWEDDSNNKYVLKNATIEIIDYNTEVAPGSASSPSKTILATTNTNSNGSFTTTLNSSGLAVRPGGYDIRIRVCSSGSYIDIKDSDISGNIHKYIIKTPFDNIATQSSPLVCDVTIPTSTSILDPLDELPPIKTHK